jgi:hypothetical protein
MNPASGWERIGRGTDTCRYYLNLETIFLIFHVSHCILQGLRDETELAIPEGLQTRSRWSRSRPLLGSFGTTWVIRDITVILHALSTVPQETNIRYTLQQCEIV